MGRTTPHPLRHLFGEVDDALVVMAIRPAFRGGAFSPQLRDWLLVSRNPGVDSARGKMAAMAVGGAGGSRVSSGRDLNCVPEIADTLGAVAKQG